MKDLDELKRLLADYHQWDSPGEVIALDTSATMRRQQIRLEVINALPDLIAEIERLRTYSTGYNERKHKLHKQAKNALNARIESLEAALREIEPAALYHPNIVEPATLKAIIRHVVGIARAALK